MTTGEWTHGGASRFSLTQIIDTFDPSAIVVVAPTPAFIWRKEDRSMVYDQDFEARAWHMIGFDEQGVAVVEKVTP
jgi:hypothetical protein